MLCMFGLALINIVASSVNCLKTFLTIRIETINPIRYGMYRALSRISPIRTSKIDLMSITPSATHCFAPSKAAYSPAGTAIPNSVVLVAVAVEPSGGGASTVTVSGTNPVAAVSPVLMICSAICVCPSIGVGKDCGLSSGCVGGTTVCY